jgi:hypothetical protein
MKFTEDHYTKNTKEAQELLLNRGFKTFSPYILDSKIFSYLCVNDFTICGTDNMSGHYKIELYCYDGDFHETPKKETKITRPTLAELLQIDQLTLAYLQNKLTWRESLEYQLERFYEIKKTIAEQLDYTNPEYSELLRLIKYYDGAIEDVKGNLC